MAPPVSRAPILAYFHPFLTQEVEDQVEGFMVLSRSNFTLEVWAGTFQVLKAGSILLVTPRVVNIY